MVLASCLIVPVLYVSKMGITSGPIVAGACRHSCKRNCSEDLSLLVIRCLMSSLIYKADPPPYNICPRS